MSFSTKTYLRNKKKITFFLIYLEDFFLKIVDVFKRIYLFFSNKEKGKSLVNVLSKSTIIVETNNFKKAINVALKHFNTKTEDQLIWKKIFYNKPSGGVINNAFKFISVQEKEDLEYFFELDNNYTTNISSVIQMYTTREGRFLKLNIFKNKKNFLSPDSIDRLIANLKIDLTREKKRDIKNKIIEDHHKPVKIGEWLPNPKIDGRALISFNKLKTEAYLTIKPPDTWGKEVDLEDVITEIKRLKIKTPYSSKEITKVLEKKIYNKPFLIVKIETFIEGSDAYFEEVFRKENSNEEIKSIPPSHYKEIFLVKRDQLIVVKHRPEDGKNAVDLFGNKIMGEKGRDADLKVGRNTYIENNSLFAKTDGCVYRINENQWVVEQTLILYEVDNKFANIEHNGTLIVKKSIVNSKPIHVSKDLIVGESIMNTSVKAGNNILVELGIIGRSNNVIESESGNLKAKYIQNVTVLVSKKIVVEEIINNCNLICGDEINFSANKGSIWGGDIKVKNQIIVYNLGSLGGLKTNVQMGFPYDYMLKMREFDVQIRDKKNKIKSLNLMRQKSILKEEVLLDIDEKLKDLKEVLFALKDEMDDYHYSFVSNFSPESKGRVTILSNFYAKVDLHFLNEEYKNLYHKKRLNIYYSNEKKKLVFEKI